MTIARLELLLSAYACRRHSGWKWWMKLVNGHDHSFHLGQAPTRVSQPAGLELGRVGSVHFPSASPPPATGSLQGTLDFNSESEQRRWDHRASNGAGEAPCQRYDSLRYHPATTGGVHITVHVLRRCLLAHGLPVPIFTGRQNAFMAGQAPWHTGR